MYELDGSAREGTLQALSSILPKLEEMDAHDPSGAAMNLGMLMNGFVRCESAQAEQVRAVDHALRLGSWADEGTRLEDTVARIIEGAKESACARFAADKAEEMSKGRVVMGMHVVAAQREAIAPFVGLSRVSGFRERDSPLDRTDEIEAIRGYLRRFDVAHLARSLEESFETREDRTLAARRAAAPKGSKTREALDVDLRVVRQARPLTATTLTAWINQHTGRPAHEMATRFGLELDFMSGEIMPSERTWRTVLAELGYLTPSSLSARSS